MPYKDKTICNDWIIRLGNNDFVFNFGNHDVSVGCLKDSIKWVDNQVEGFFTAPCFINLSKVGDEDNCVKVLSHEFLHYILFKYLGFSIIHFLDRLNGCATKDLDNSGLGKYVGWGGVY